MFDKFLGQIKDVKLSMDKFLIVKNTSSHWFFTGKQICDIALCFPHSSDKKEAVALLEERLCSQVSCEAAAAIIKSTSFSKDKIAILQVLVTHLSEIDDQSELKLVVNSFDFFIDKDEAWDILNRHCQTRGASCPPLTDGLANGEQIEWVYEKQLPMHKVDQFIRDLTNQTQASATLTVFDLPILNELPFFKQNLDDGEFRENVERAVQKRKETRTNFVIPSRIWTISTNLKPGRRLVAPPEIRPPRSRVNSAAISNKEEETIETFHGENETRPNMEIEELLQEQSEKEEEEAEMMDFPAEMQEKSGFATIIQNYSDQISNYSTRNRQPVR